MNRYFIGRRAAEDLAEIHAFISRDRPDAADRQIEAFFHTIETIASQPLIGELHNDLLPELRTFSVGNFVICYAITGDHIDVARVLHGARDIAAILRTTKDD